MNCTCEKPVVRNDRCMKCMKFNLEGKPMTINNIKVKTLDSLLDELSYFANRVNYLDGCLVQARYNIEEKQKIIDKIIADNQALEDKLSEVEGRILMYAADYLDRKLVKREKRSSIIGAIVLTIAALVIGSLITLGFCLR